MPVSAYVFLTAALSVSLFLFSGCGGEKKSGLNAAGELPVKIVSEADAEAARLRERAARIVQSLDTRLLAAQVIISGIDGKERLTGDMRALFKECPAGGVMLFRYNLDSADSGIRNLTAEIAAFIAEYSGRETIAGGISPFIAADHEGGSVCRLPPGIADLPPPESYWQMAQTGGRDAACARVEMDSFGAGDVIADLGINLNFAPVVEPLNAGNREFLDDRSFGPDAAFAAEASAAFIRGMERAGVLCVIKHFPGSAGKDPHRFPSVLNSSPDELAALTFPFAELVRRGQGRAVMAAHTLVPARDPFNVASLSPEIMGQWLRRETGFSGIIISDDFAMAAARCIVSREGGVVESSLSPEDAAVRSLAAGADMILVWPPDLRNTHRAILEAIEDGELSGDRLREAAGRIIFEKLRMGIITDDE